MQTDLITSVAELNKKYEPLSVEDRIKELYKDFDVKEVLLTSSFAANSAFLLHLYSRYAPTKQPVHFIDTTYHFEETLRYKEYISEKYQLDVIDIVPDEKENQFTKQDQTWKKNPDFCCSINKVKPLQKVANNYTVWASGLMRTQNEHRKNLNVFTEKKGMLRFYPIIDVTPEERDDYIKNHQLPFHPLVEEGYKSIGCKHCTVKGENREGRWVGLAKTECGLHI
ncbi:MAG: phosphoadenylyl-sulfate reductase [Bacteroidota bacterium]